MTPYVVVLNSYLEPLSLLAQALITMNIKIQQIRHFICVVEAGGFRAAAEKANRSQAALSNSVKALEVQLGHPLFESKKSLQLSFFGRQCLPRFRGFLNHYQQMSEELYDIAEGNLGRLRIASLPSIATHLLPKFIASFCDQHPTLKLEMQDDHASGINRRLINGDIDIAISNCLPENLQKMTMIPLLKDPVGVVVHRNHPLAQRDSIDHWEQLKPYDYIANGTGVLLNGSDATELIAKAKFTVNNITSLFSMLDHDIGITTLPKLAMPRLGHELVWRPLCNPCIEREIGIIHRQDQNLSPATLAFIKAIKHFVRNETLSA